VKIALAGYPLTQLFGGETQKKTGMRAQNGFLGRIDVPVLSKVPDKAVVKYLQAIDAILSDIIRIVDDNAALTGSEDITAVSRKMPQQAFITPQDALIYLPAAVSTGEGDVSSGELVIIKNVLQPGETDISGEPEGSAAVSLSRDIARGLPGIGVGMGMKEEDLTAPFVNTAGVKGTPVRSGPVEATKDILSLSGKKDGQTASQGERVEEESYEAAMPDIGTFIGPADLSEKPPGVSIRFIDPAGMGVSGVASGKKDRIIIESMTSLAAAVNDIIGSQVETEEGPGNAAAQMAVARTTVKEAVKESLLMALRYGQGGVAPSGGDPFGLRTDEKGLLRVDRAMFAEALAGKKEETFRFVNNFGSSFHDRISYFFHPFAGLYAGAPDAAGLKEPGNKEGVADDREDRKAGFEKRLGELQMLLKSSYELKESFMQKRLSGQNVPDEETY